MTAKDLIAKLSTLGEILKMLPGAPVTDDVLHEAIARQEPGQKIGAVLVSMRVITDEQLRRALELQQKIRASRDLVEVQEFFDEVRRERERVSDLAFQCLPDTNHGETR